MSLPDNHTYEAIVKYPWNHDDTLTWSAASTDDNSIQVKGVERPEVCPEKTSAGCGGKIHFEVGDLITSSANANIAGSVTCDICKNTEYRIKTLTRTGAESDSDPTYKITLVHGNTEINAIGSTTAISLTYRPRISAVWSSADPSDDTITLTESDGLVVGDVVKYTGQPSITPLSTNTNYKIKSKNGNKITLIAENQDVSANAIALTYVPTATGIMQSMDTIANTFTVDDASTFFLNDVVKYNKGSGAIISGLVDNAEYKVKTIDVNKITLGAKTDNTEMILTYEPPVIGTWKSLEPDDNNKKMTLTISNLPGGSMVTGDTVTYTHGGGTPVSPLENNVQYTIKSITSEGIVSLKTKAVSPVTVTFNYQAERTFIRLGIDLDSNTILFSSITNLDVGDPVVFKSPKDPSAIGGLIHETTYYIKTLSQTTNNGGYPVTLKTKSSEDTIVLSRTSTVSCSSGKLMTSGIGCEKSCSSGIFNANGDGCDATCGLGSDGDGNLCAVKTAEVRGASVGTASSEIAATYTHTAFSTDLVVGERIIVSGHTDDDAHKDMNQVYIVASRTDATHVVLTGDFMTVGTYNTGTILLTRPFDVCKVSSNTCSFEAAGIFEAAGTLENNEAFCSIGAINSGGTGCLDAAAVFTPESAGNSDSSFLMEQIGTEGTSLSKLTKAAVGTDGSSSSTIVRAVVGSLGEKDSRFTRAVEGSLGSNNTKFFKKDHLVHYNRKILRTKVLYDWYSELRADTCPFESDVDIVPKCPGNVPYVEWIIINGLKAEGPLLIKEIEAYDTNGVKLTFGTGSVIIDHSNDITQSCYSGTSPDQGPHCENGNRVESKAGSTSWTVAFKITGGTKCVARIALTPRDATNIETSGGGGTNGGKCTCPDGQTYWVGDNNNNCASLACVGGTHGSCDKLVDDKGKNKKVVCAGAGLATFKKGKTVLQLKSVKDGISELDSIVTEPIGSPDKWIYNMTRPTFGTNREWTDKTYQTLKYTSPCTSKGCMGRETYIENSQEHLSPIPYKFYEMLTSKADTNACHLQKRDYCAKKTGVTKAKDSGCFHSTAELNIKTTKTELSKDISQASSSVTSPYFSQDCTFTPFSKACYTKKLNYCATGDTSQITKTNNVGCFQPTIKYTSTACIFDVNRLDSPCHDLDCIKTPDSKTCREFILDYCARDDIVNTANKDAGCFLDVPVVGYDDCTTITSQDSPCFSPECAKDETSVACLNDRNTFCEQNVNEGISASKGVETTCSDNLKQLSGNSNPIEGDLFRVTGCTQKATKKKCTYQKKSVFGVNVYSSNSSICSAAQHAGVDIAKEFVVAVIRGRHGYVSGTLSGQESTAAGKTALAFTVRQNSGCFHTLEIDTKMLLPGPSDIKLWCDDLYDNTNPTSPCLNQKCWNKGTENHPNIFPGTSCLDVQRDYCKSNVVSAATEMKDKACFLLRTGLHKSECPYDWGKLKDDNNDETLSPCHAHQCFDTTKGMGRHQKSPRPVSHPSRLTECTDIVNTYCFARPWEPYCFAKATTRYPALDLGILGCERLFYGKVSEGRSICRSPSCTPHAPQVHLMPAPALPVRYLKVTPTSDGTRGVLEFHGLSSPFLYPEVVAGVENDVRVVGSLSMEHKTFLKGSVRIRLDLESDWSSGDVSFLELTPKSFTTSATSTQVPCDMPQITMSYNQNEWSFTIDQDNMQILETQTKGVSVIVLDRMSFQHKSTKYFDTRETAGTPTTTQSSRRFPIVLHSAYPENTLNTGAHGVLSWETDAAWASDLGWKVDSSKCGSDDSNPCWVRFVACNQGYIHDASAAACVEPVSKNDVLLSKVFHTVVEAVVHVNVTSGSTLVDESMLVPGVKFSLSYRVHEEDSWIEAGSTTDVKLMSKTGGVSTYVITLEDLVAHGSEWKINIENSLKTDFFIITEIALYTHIKSLVSGTDEDGSQASALATYLDTLDSSDVVVVAAPFGSQHEMGSKVMDALTLVGATAVEVASFSPWATIGRKVEDAVRITKSSSPTFSTKQKANEKERKERKHVSGKHGRKHGNVVKHDVGTLSEIFKVAGTYTHVRPVFVDFDGDGDMDIIATALDTFNKKLQGKVITSWSLEGSSHFGINTYKLSALEIEIVLKNHPGILFKGSVYNDNIDLSTAKEQCEAQGFLKCQFVWGSESQHQVYLAKADGIPTPIVMYYEKKDVEHSEYIRADSKLSTVKLGRYAVEAYPTFAYLRGNDFAPDLVIVERTPKIGKAPDFDTTRTNDIGIVKTFRFDGDQLFELTDVENPLGGSHSVSVLSPLPNRQWNLAFGRLNGNGGDLHILAGGGTLQHYRMSSTTGIVEKVADDDSSVISGLKFPEKTQNIVPVLHDINGDGLLDVMASFEILGGRYTSHRTDGSNWESKMYAHIDAWVNDGTFRAPSFSNVVDGVYIMERRVEGGFCSTDKSSSAIQNVRTIEACEQACINDDKCKHISFSVKPICDDAGIKKLDTSVFSPKDKKIVHDGVIVSSHNGYYDLQSCGSCKEYCRWTDSSGEAKGLVPTKDDPKENQKEGNKIWKCDTTDKAGKVFTVKEWNELGLKNEKCTINHHLEYLGHDGCSIDNKCTVCEGQCDNDDECVGDLKCSKTTRIYYNINNIPSFGCAANPNKPSDVKTHWSTKFHRGSSSSAYFCYDPKHAEGRSKKSTVDLSISGQCYAFYDNAILEKDSKYYLRRGHGVLNTDRFDIHKLTGDECYDKEWDKPDDWQRVNDVEHAIETIHGMEKWTVSNKIYQPSVSKIPKLPFRLETYSKHGIRYDGNYGNEQREDIFSQPHIAIEPTKDSYNVWAGLKDGNALYNDAAISDADCRSTAIDGFSCSNAQYNGKCVKKDNAACWQNAAYEGKWSFQCPHDATPERIIVGVTKEGIYARSSFIGSSSINKLLPSDYKEIRQDCGSNTLRNMTVVLHQGVVSVSEAQCDMKFEIPIHHDVATEHRLSISTMQPAVDALHLRRLLNLQVDEITSTTSNDVTSSGDNWKSISSYVAGVVPKDFVPISSALSGSEIIGGKHRIGGRNAYVERPLVLPHHVGLRLTLKVVASFSPLEEEKYSYYNTKKYVVIYLDNVPISRMPLSSSAMGGTVSVDIPHTNFEAVLKVQVSSNAMSTLGWWGIEEMNVHILRPSDAKMHLNYGTVSTLPDMWTNVTANGMASILQQIPGLEPNGVHVTKKCDAYFYCTWDVKFAGLIHGEKKFEKLTMDLSDWSTQHILLSDTKHLTYKIHTLHTEATSAFGSLGPDTTKSAFTGYREIDISEDKQPWLPHVKKFFQLPNIYMATVTAFTVQVALHNAGGYSGAVTIVPNPPEIPEGLNALMNLQTGVTSVPIKLPVKTNGASVTKIFYNWASYYDSSMENGFEVHTVHRHGQGQKVRTSCPDETTSAVTCTCEPSNFCKSVSFVVAEDKKEACVAMTDGMASEQDVLIKLTCSHAIANLTKTMNTSKSTSVTSSGIKEATCPRGQHAISCSVQAADANSHAAALEIVDRTSDSCSLPTTTTDIGVTVQVRCVNVTSIQGTKMVEVALLKTEVDLNTGDIWHQAGLNITSGSGPMVPVRIMARVENFFGKSLSKSRQMHANVEPNSFKIRVDPHIKGLQVLVTEDAQHPTTGLPEDRYLVEYWPTYHGRAQIVLPPVDLAPDKCIVGQSSTNTQCEDATTEDACNKASKIGNDCKWTFAHFFLEWNGVSTLPIPSIGKNASQVAQICSDTWKVRLEGTDYVYYEQANKDGTEVTIPRYGWRLVFLHVPPTDAKSNTIESIVAKTEGTTIVPTSMRGSQYVPVYTLKELLSTPILKKTNQNLRINVPNIEYVDIVPYAASVHACNFMGCSKGVFASVGPPNVFTIDQVDIEWRSHDSINIQVSRHAGDETFVDEMKLHWEQSLSDLQVQRVVAQRLPVSTSPSTMVMFHDQSFDHDSDTVQSTTMTDGNLISRQLSEWGTFCIPKNCKNCYKDTANKDAWRKQFTNYGGKYAICRDNQPNPLKIEFTDATDGKKSNPMWTIFKSNDEIGISVGGELPAKPMRPAGPYIHFGIKYNELLKDADGRMKFQNWKEMFGSTQTGCMPPIKNLRYPVVAKRSYRFSVMISVLTFEDDTAQGTNDRTMDIIPYLTSSSKEDNVWCYGSRYLKEDGVSYISTQTALPKYALGDQGEVGPIDVIRALRLDSKTVKKWFLLEWNFLAPESDIGPLDVLNFAFVDPARRWALESTSNKKKSWEELTKTNPQIQIYGPVLMEGRELDLHTVLNSNHFFVAMVVPKEKEMELKFGRRGGKDYSTKIAATTGTFGDDDGHYKVDRKEHFVLKTSPTEIKVIIQNEEASISSTLKFEASLLGSGGEILTMEVQHVEKTTFFEVSLSNSTSTYTETTDSGPVTISNDHVWIKNIPQLQILSGAPQKVFVDRIMQNRGFLTSIVSRFTNDTIRKTVSKGSCSTSVLCKIEERPIQSISHTAQCRCVNVGHTKAASICRLDENTQTCKDLDLLATADSEYVCQSHNNVNLDQNQELTFDQCAAQCNLMNMRIPSTVNAVVFASGSKDGCQINNKEMWVTSHQWTVPEFFAKENTNGGKTWTDQDVVVISSPMDYNYRTIREGSGGSDTTAQCARSDALHAIRCCTTSGQKVQDNSDSGPFKCQESVTYKAANTLCVSKGHRLCTDAEIKAQTTKGAGCGFDNKKVWTSDMCTSYRPSTSVPSAVKISKTDHSTSDGAFMLSGWFLPTLTGNYHFTVTCDEDITELNTAVYVHTQPSHGCSPMKKLSLKGIIKGSTSTTYYEPIALQAGFEYSYIVLRMEKASNLQIGVYFPGNTEEIEIVGIVGKTKAGFYSNPLHHIYTTTTPQKVEGMMKLTMPPNEESELSIWSTEEDFIQRLKKETWIDNVIVPPPTSDGERVCQNERIINMFEITIDSSKVHELYGLLSLIDTSFSTTQGNMEFYLTVQDVTKIDRYKDWIKHAQTVVSITPNPSDAPSNRLESLITKLPPVGTSKISMHLAMCNAYGCSPAVDFKIDIFEAPTQLKYLEVTSGSALITFDVPNMEWEKNILTKNLVQYCVEMRDQTGTEWVEVKASRPEDGPKGKRNCLSKLGEVIECQGFKIGGLVHSTRVEFRVSVLGDLHVWSRSQKDTETSIFPVPWNSRAGRLSNNIRVFTSGPNVPEKSSKPLKILASGGAVEISWMAPYSTGGIALSQFYLYQGDTVADFGPVKEVGNVMYRVPNYQPNTKETFILGGLRPFKTYKFSVQYSNVAEACFGRSSKSEALVRHSNNTFSKIIL